MGLNQVFVSSRLKSLDVFRGLTIALMILVNSPGYPNAYACLEHARWHGCSIADLVFPFFIVIVGMSSVLALSHLKAQNIPNSQLIKKIIKRSLYLFAVGVLLNAFPNHFDGSHLRIFGVLQRIAICYFVSASLFLTTRLQVQYLIFCGILLVYWLLIGFISPLGANYSSLSVEGNLASFVDRLILGPEHLYSTAFDPEGLLSTIPAIASVLLGNLLGAHLILPKSKPQQLYWIIALAFIMLALAWLWHFTLPFNKALWTSSYVLWTSGLAYLVFALCFFLIEIKQWTAWSKPFALFGKHAMLIYVLHVLLLKIQAMVKLYNADAVLVNLRVYITELLFGHLQPLNASLCYALSYTLFWLIFLKFWMWLGIKTEPRLSRSV